MSYKLLSWSQELYQLLRPEAALAPVSGPALRRTASENNLPLGNATQCLGAAQSKTLNIF